MHDLYRHLAACDLAVVQGGLTTTMELTASRRPFIYVPLRHHFEQNFHVRHRLARYDAGRCLDYDETTPEGLAPAIAAEIGAPGQLPAGRDRRRRPRRGQPGRAHLSGVQLRPALRRCLASRSTLTRSASAPLRAHAPARSRDRASRGLLA